MSNHFFKFKQFTVFHDLCAMKVGTDGVLLGAWCDIQSKKRVLDIGTGTGLISLMIAQRNQEAMIDAVEIEPDAAHQAVVNFEKSPWANRLKLFGADFIHFASETTCKYDLIVSNPPYFENALKADCNKRSQARHTDSLSYEQLIAASASLLSDNGSLALIYPIEMDLKIQELAIHNKLTCTRRTVVKGNPQAAPKRLLAEFKPFGHTAGCVENELIVEAERHQYTSDYIALTRAFYLKMD